MPTELLEYLFTRAGLMTNRILFLAVVAVSATALALPWFNRTSECYAMTNDQIRAIIGGQQSTSQTYDSSYCKLFSGCDPLLYPPSTCEGNDESECSTATDREFPENVNTEFCELRAQPGPPCYQDQGLAPNCRVDHSCKWHMGHCIKDSFLTSDAAPSSCDDEL